MTTLTYKHFSKVLTAEFDPKDYNLISLADAKCLIRYISKYLQTYAYPKGADSYWQGVIKSGYLSALKYFATKKLYVDPANFINIVSNVNGIEIDIVDLSKIRIELSLSSDYLWDFTQALEDPSMGFYHPRALRDLWAYGNGDDIKLTDLDCLLNLASTNIKNSLAINKLKKYMSTKVRYF